VFSSDLPGLNPATLNGMILYYRLMTKWGGLGDSTELSRMGLSHTPCDRKICWKSSSVIEYEALGLDLGGNEVVEPSLVVEELLVCLIWTSWGCLVRGRGRGRCRWRRSEEAQILARWRRGRSGWRRWKIWAGVGIYFIGTYLICGDADEEGGEKTDDNDGCSKNKEVNTAEGCCHSG
jgi:hypothetical protein